MKDSLSVNKHEFSRAKQYLEVAPPVSHGQKRLLLIALRPCPGNDTSHHSSGIHHRSLRHFCFWRSNNSIGGFVRRLVGHFLFGLLLFLFFVSLLPLLVFLQWFVAEIIYSKPNLFRRRRSPKHKPICFLYASFRRWLAFYSFHDQLCLLLNKIAVHEEQAL